jgi:hypothetical protein
MTSTTARTRRRTAAILATGLLAMGQVSQSPEYVQMTSLAALMCAVLLIAARS